MKPHSGLFIVAKRRSRSGQLWLFQEDVRVRRVAARRAIAAALTAVLPHLDVATGNAWDARLAPHVEADLSLMRDEIRRFLNRLKRSIR